MSQIECQKERQSRIEYYKLNGSRKVKQFQCKMWCGGWNRPWLNSLDRWICASWIPLFPNSVSLWGLQPRKAPVSTGAGAGWGSTRYRRMFRRFRRRSGRLGAEPGSTGLRRRFRGRSGRLWCRARSVSTGFRRSSGEGSRKPWCKAKSGSTGFRIREALVQSQVKFNRVPVKVPRARSGSRGFRRRLQRRSPRRFWESLVQGQVQQGSGEGSGEGLGGFGAEPGQVQQIPEKVPEKVPGSHGAKPGQVQQGSGEGSGKGLGGFGAEPGQAQQGSGEGSGEGLGGFGAELGQVQQGSENCGWCTARSGSRGFWRIPEKAWEALVQSQVRFKRVPKVWEALVQGQARFNSVPEKFYEKFLGGFGAEPGQVQQGSGECSGECLGGFGAARSSLTGPEKVPGEGLGLWCRARSGSRGFRRRLQRRSRRRFRESLVQGQVRFNGFWRSLFLFFMFFGFAVRFREICDLQK